MIPQGLNSNEVDNRLNLIGYNELPIDKPKSIFRIALEVIKEPMFLILISCGILYIAIGDITEGVVLMSTIFIIIFITFYQHQKTEKALNAMKHLSSPSAIVIRNGQEIKIPVREVVPDDIVLVNEGDRIPADGVLIKTFGFTVDESILTGESLAVQKFTSTDVSHNSSSFVFAGTLVVQGRGYIKISATGTNTKFGKIGTSISSISQHETNLQLEMKVLIRNFFIIGILVSLSIGITFYFVRGNLIEAVLNGLSSAMAILPEEFPVVYTVFLALGAWRLSKKNILTRKPSAIETLGSITVLCSDKTGTITQNKMEVVAVYNGKETLHKNSFADNHENISEVLKFSFLASQENPTDPMEKAFELAHQTLNKNNNPPLKVLKEYPISKSLFAMTRILLDHNNNQITGATKGSPESIFKLCKLNTADTLRYMTVVESLAVKGYRVIAVASSTYTSVDLPESQVDFNFSFLGLIGLEDPIRPEVPQFIKECTTAGVKVIMITGDYPSTANSIAIQIGMNTEDKLITGEELDLLDEDELKSAICNINIFARVIPEQKLRIIQSLQANHEIVAMTGDGINDAPALKAADIGISMGNKGTDVARESSALILLDDNFASIVIAIRLGRKIFDNLQKAMSYILAIHIPIIGLTLMPALFPSLPILLMPLHIVILELIIDPICSIAFEHEKEEENIMTRKPRDPKEKFFGMKKIIFSIIQGLLLFGMTATVYLLSFYEGHTNEEVRTIAFSSLVIGNIFLILTNLSKSRNVIQIIKEKNIALYTILSSASILLMVIISVPFLRRIFSFQFPGYKHFISSIVGAFAVLIILEGVKHFKKYWGAKTSK